MQPLFAVPPPLSESPPYYPYNAWSSLPLALPFLAEPTSIYGSMSGLLAATSFIWWWSGDEHARIIDVACVGYFMSYPAAISCGANAIPPLVASASVVLGLARWDNSLQLVLATSATASLVFLAINREYFILVSTLLALASKLSHTVGIQTIGTALFHLIAGVVLMRIQTHSREGSWQLTSA